MNNDRPFFFETGTSNLTSTFVRKWVAYIFYKSRVRGPFISNVILHCYSFFNSLRHRLSKDGLMSEETGGFLHIQNEYSKSLSWAENLDFPPKIGNKLFKFSSQDSDLNIYLGNVKILQYFLTLSHIWYYIQSYIYQVL